MQKLLYNAVHTKAGGEAELIYTNSGNTYMPTEKISMLHYHNRCEIGICKKGNGIWVMGDRSYAVSTGDIIVNPAGFPHYSRTIPTLDHPRCQVKYYYFDERRLFDETGIRSDISLCDGSVTSPVVLTRNRHGELWLMLDKMLHELQGGVGEDTYKLAAHWYAIFLLKLRRQSFESAREYPSVNPVFLPAFRKIVAEFSEQLTVKELADACSLSPNYFNTGFRKCFGLTPMRYLNRFRAEIAAELLCESNISVTDISNFVGFITPSELYRHFIALYGMSPSKYRSYRNT